jgi:hypothetical protein
MRPTAVGFVPAAFAFALAVAFVPWFTNAATAPRWALLSVGVPLLVSIFPPYRVVEKIDMATALGLAFLAYAAASLAWTPDPYQGTWLLWQWLLLAGAFTLGSRLSCLRPVVVGAGLGLAISGAIAVAQALGWQSIPQNNAPAGLFVNRNYLAEAAVLALVGAVGFRLWWLAAALVPAIVLPTARGAAVALAGVGAAWLWTRSRLAAALLIAGMAAALPLTYSAHNASIGQRVDLWKSTVAGLTWTGSGVGSFYARFPSHAPDWPLLEHRPAHAHSDPLELVYEFGIGAVPIGALLVLLMWGPLTPARAMLLAFLIEGAFGFPLRWPVTAFLAALAAGHLCRDRGSDCGGAAHG